MKKLILAFVTITSISTLANAGSITCVGKTATVFVFRDETGIRLTAVQKNWLGTTINIFNGKIQCYGLEFNQPGKAFKTFPRHMPTILLAVGKPVST